MPFYVADTFENSLGRLTGEEQKAAKLTVYELQTQPDNPGLNYEVLKQPKDKNFRSVRVNRDIRIIVHRLSDSLVACYVDHHDKAYDWAARRRLETHPTTGAAQLVEVRETVREIEVPVYTPASVEPSTHTPAAAPSPVFDSSTDEDLLAFGVPPDWLEDVRGVVDDAGLERLAEYLPAEATEALWELATGGTPAVAVPASEGDDPFAHPDAQRRFLLVNTEEELQRALDYPWERWMVFLHPAQRELIAKDFNGPARVAGSAGTGKTVVALHRAAHAARAHPDARVLLTTFNGALAQALQMKLNLLLAGEPRIRERLDVRALDDVALATYRGERGEPQLVEPETVGRLIGELHATEPDLRLGEELVRSEWVDVVDEWQLSTWEAYRDVPRLGRKKGLREEQRSALWKLFARMDGELSEQGLETMPRVYSAATETVEKRGGGAYDFIVVDEAQDVSVPQLRFLAALAGERSDRLFFAGDLGQRIFQTPFSWKALDVDVRGRSRTLRVNYRTSHEIRRSADRLLPPELSDVDGNSESRRGTVSVFTGAPPLVLTLPSAEDERDNVGKWLRALVDQGVTPNEIGIFVRSEPQLERGRDAAEVAGLVTQLLSPGDTLKPNHVAIGTMENAKGLEFRAVVVPACDEDVIPSQARIDEIGDYADLEDTWETERQLLYVACTRARDHLLVTGVAPGSEFLEDLTG